MDNKTFQVLWWRWKQKEKRFQQSTGQTAHLHTQPLSNILEKYLGFDVVNYEPVISLQVTQTHVHNLQDQNP